MFTTLTEILGPLAGRNLDWDRLRILLSLAPPELRDGIVRAMQSQFTAIISVAIRLFDIGDQLGRDGGLAISEPWTLLAREVQSAFTSLVAAIEATPGLLIPETGIDQAPNPNPETETLLALLNRIRGMAKGKGPASKTSEVDASGNTIRGLAYVARWVLYPVNSQQAVAPTSTELGNGIRQNGGGFRSFKDAELDCWADARSEHRRYGV
jgi:hypothetical protein